MIYNNKHPKFYLQLHLSTSHAPASEFSQFIFLTAATKKGLKTPASYCRLGVIIRKARSLGKTVTTMKKKDAQSVVKSNNR